MATYEKTDKPGVYLRGSTYYCAVTSGGKTKKIAAGKTLSAAVKLKRKLESERDRGHDPFGRRENERFADYARAWIAGCSGRGSHRIGERTRLEYARDMENHVLPWMGQTRLGRVSRKTIRDLVAHLQGDDCNLADASVRRVMAPVKACLATAYEDGDLAANPAQGVRILATPRPVGETRAKALTREQLALLIERTDPRWQSLIRLLASTGLRISEALALTWADVDLGNRPSVTVSKAVKRDEPGRIGVPKSRNSNRTVPLSTSLAMELRARRAESEWGRYEDWVFATDAGTLPSDSNLRHRVLRPAAKAAGVPKLGFHGLRHTFASILIDEGRNIRQVSALLGHASPSFTLQVYVHLMADDAGGPLDLDAALAPASLLSTETTGPTAAAA